MQNNLLLSNVKSFLSNEIDYLTFLGVSTGMVFRYVRATKNLTPEELARTLQISVEQEVEMEHSGDPLHERWQKILRNFYT